PNAEPKFKEGVKSLYVLTFVNAADAVKKTVPVKREKGDKVIVAAVPDKLVDKVTAGPLTYRDKSLPGFDGDATKLVLERGGETWELVKEKKDSKTEWQIKQPKDLAGRLANNFTVEGIIGDLKHLRAEKLLDEKATPELEQKYGLNKPRIKATVTVTKEGKSE